MKTILLIISLTCFKAMASFGQVYYGGSIGVSIEKYWNPNTKEIKTGINDIYLCTPIGYAGKFWVAELSPQTNLSLTPSLAGMIGGKLDFSEHCGIHFLGGYRDEMLVNMKPFGITHFFFPQSTLRIWIDNFDVESKYIFRKQEFGGNSFEFGIGVIGF